MAQPGSAMPVNEAMCGIGAFIERNEHQYLVIKNVTPDGPASRNPDLYPGEFQWNVCVFLLLYGGRNHAHSEVHRMADMRVLAGDVIVGIDGVSAHGMTMIQVHMCVLHACIRLVFKFKVVHLFSHGFALKEPCKLLAADTTIIRSPFCMQSASSGLTAHETCYARRISSIARACESMRPLSISNATIPVLQSLCIHMYFICRFATR